MASEMTFDDDSVSLTGSCVVRSVVSRKSKSLDGDVGAILDDNLIKRAKKAVNTAMNDRVTGGRMALRLEHFVVEHLKKEQKKKLEGDFYVFPPCTNKYHLMSKDKSVELLVHLRPTLKDVQEELMLVSRDDIAEAVDFALALKFRGCALPSKVWGEVKAAASERYMMLGSHRLDELKISQHGDRKSVYYDINYAECGAFQKVFKTVKKQQMIVGIKHVGGRTLPLRKPLPLSYFFVENNIDREAKLVSTESEEEATCFRVFENAGFGHEIPIPLADERVGMPVTPSPKKRKTANLAILDDPNRTPPQGNQSSSSSSPLIVNRGGAPAGSGVGIAPRARPIRRRVARAT